VVHPRKILSGPYMGSFRQKVSGGWQTRVWRLFHRLVVPTFRVSSINTSHAGSKCVRMLLDSFDITTATGNYICMVHRPLGLRISDFQPLIPGGRLPQDILKLTLKHVLLGLEFLHSE
jgi:hypothetical protein